MRIEGYGDIFNGKSFGSSSYWLSRKESICKGNELLLSYAIWDWHR